MGAALILAAVLGYFVIKDQRRRAEGVPASSTDGKVVGPDWTPPPSPQPQPSPQPPDPQPQPPAPLPPPQPPAPSPQETRINYILEQTGSTYPGILRPATLLSRIRDIDAGVNGYSFGYDVYRDQDPNSKYVGLFFAVTNSKESLPQFWRESTQQALTAKMNFYADTYRNAAAEGKF